MESSKEMVSKLTGIHISGSQQPQVPQDEDALLESINNLDYLLVQQKMPNKEKHDARLKLAEHMGIVPEQVPIVPSQKNIQA